jgi:hypothetical protein
MAKAGGQMTKRMTEDQIPEFVREVAAIGCNICAIGNHNYLIGDVDLPDDVYEAIKLDLKQIAEKYHERDHLNSHIVEYLHSIGRSYPLPGLRSSWQTHVLGAEPVGAACESSDEHIDEA